jgi:ribose transport system substrate-binding protein
MSYWAKRFGMKNLGTISTTDDTAAGQGNAMTAILSKYPDVTTVMAYSDSAAGAAGSVARASGKANVKVWGNNGEPNVMKQIKAGRVYGTFNSDFTSSGRLMAIAVYDLLTHQNLPLPKQIGLGGKVVTKANVAHANPLGVDGPLPPVSAATSRRMAATAPKLPSLANLYAGTNKAPGGTPVPAQKGKKVFVISCGQAASGCSIPTAGAVAAGKELGWDVTTLDVAFDLSKQGPMVDQAIAGGAQGIIVVGDDCSLSPAALQRAKDAHIPVDNVYGADCNEPYQPGDPVGADLWTDVPTAGYTTNPAFFAAFGVAKAQYLIAKTKGTARVITSDITDVALLVGQVRAFKNAMAKCKTCKVYDVHSKALDFGPNLQRITQQAVLQHPDANAVAPTNDSVYLGGVQAGLKAAGGKKLVILGSDGTPPGMALLKSGELAAELAFPADWYGWAAADTMNSLLAGKKPRNSGVGWQLIDKGHNMNLVGSDGGYKPAIDYKAAYRKLWGLK